MNIVIIGGGNMGLAHAKLFSKASAVDVQQLTIVEKEADRRKVLKKLHIGTVIGSLDGEYISEANLILLAVKPQNAERVFSEVKPYIRDSHLVVSIMAGIKMRTIMDKLAVTQVVRTMPNLPLVVSEGMTVYTASDKVDKKMLTLIEHLMMLSGKSICVKDEDLLDASTAISGSGPAFVFYILQSFIQAATELGFTASEAELLVCQTFAGSLHLLGEESLNCEQWIQRVSSKGGTTQAGLCYLEKQKLNGLLEKAIKTAYERAKELSNLSLYN